MGFDAYNARRVALGAGLPTSSTALNVNRLCASGLQAVITGAQEILTGQADIIVAGGNESIAASLSSSSEREPAGKRVIACSSTGLCRSSPTRSAVIRWA